MGTEKTLDIQSCNGLYDMGMVFDIKRYAIHDGPGIRTTVFLKGCPLNCLWCHNPEGIRQEQELMWWEERCMGCRNCENECPRGAVSFSDNSILVDQNECDMCGICAKVCVPRALTLVGEEMTVPQLMKEIERDLIFYDESGGGMSLSGGEPLMQPEFSRALLRTCKELNIHTTLDTCGYSKFDTLAKICEHVDLVLYDLKVINDEKHAKCTGVSNKRILDNLKRLSQNGGDILVRFPLIPGINDHERDIEELGLFVSSLENIRGISILPYHKAGAEKTKRLTLSKNSFLVDPALPSLTIDEIEMKLKSYQLTVQVGA